MVGILKEIRADAIVERVRTNSVLNSLLWLCGITALTATPAAYSSTGYAQVFFCTLAAAPIFAAISAYAYFAFHDPDRLHSEEYLLERQRIMQASKEDEEILTTSKAIDHEPRKIPEIEVLSDDEPITRVSRIQQEANRS